MKWIIAFILIFTATVPRAEVRPDHVESMLDQMVRENVISKEEADKVKMKMKTIPAEKWGEINKKASTINSRSPASTNLSENKIEEVKNIDLDGAQFKTIENEVYKIIPEYRDRN